MRVNHKILRRGKNNVTFEAHLDSDAGPGTYGYFTFGVSRKMARQMDYPKHELPVSPQMGEELIPHNVGRNFWLILTEFGPLARPCLVVPIIQI